MSSGALTRVRWREGQLVLAADLAVEQGYRLAARHRHHRGHHRPGLVAGLGVAPSPGGLTVEPGYALDAAGHAIVLPAAETVSLERLDQAFARAGRDELVLTLVRLDLPSLSPRPGLAPCGPGRHDRWQESRCLALRSDPPAGADLSPHDPDPSPDAASTPIPLATVRRLADGYEVEPRPRTPAGLVAQQVRDPEGRVAVRLLEGPGRPRVTVAVGDGAEPAPDRLVVDRDLLTTVSGPAVTGDGVRLVEKGPGPSQRVRFAQLGATPEAARPWTVYRTRFEEVDDAGRPVGAPRNQLRFELGPPGEDGDPEGYLLAVGRRIGGVFRPCLRVDATCTVRVANLVVEGQLVESPIPADPTDPRFADAAGGTWLGGVGSAVGQTAALSVTLPDRVEVLEGERVDLEARIANTGAAGLTTVAVWAQAAGGGVIVPAVKVATVPILAAGATTEVAASLDPLAAGDYNLVVSAVADAPGSLPVAAADTSTVVVTPAIA